MVSLMALNKGLKGSVCGILLKNGGVSSFQDITNSQQKTNITEGKQEGRCYAKVGNVRE